MEFMQVGDRIVLAVTHAELLLIAGSINEALEAVEGWEFSTRLGASQADARQLLDDVHEVMAGLPRWPE